MDGMQLIAAARATAFDSDAVDFPHVTVADAEAASTRTIDPTKHVLPYCFVCGPGRTHGDGLRIFAGPLDPDDTDWSGALAASWTPDDSLAGDDGMVAPEFVWAALDCPTGYTAHRPDGHGLGPNQSILLGRLIARIDARPHPGDACSIVTRLVSREGRKITADAVLRNGQGDRLATARALWITVDRAVLMGEA